MKDILFHLPNEGLEDLESFALFFLCTYKQTGLFLHIWFIASGHENSLPCGSLSRFLVPDRFGDFII